MDSKSGVLLIPHFVICELTDAWQSLKREAARGLRLGRRGRGGRQFLIPQISHLRLEGARSSCDEACLGLGSLTEGGAVGVFSWRFDAPQGTAKIKSCQRQNYDS